MFAIVVPHVEPPAGRGLRHGPRQAEAVGAFLLARHAAAPRVGSKVPRGRSRRALMRFAIIRQRYRVDGAVERAMESALEALLERNVAISLVTRSAPPTRLQLIEPVLCDPPHAGALWRDWGFARAACRVIRRSTPALVESHERLLCCDVYRAADGVHAVRLDEHGRRASPGARIAAMLSPHDRYLLHVERRMYASRWLRAVICNSKMVRDEIRDRYAVPESKLHVVYNPVDGEHFHPGLRAERPRSLERHRIDPGATVYLAAAADFARGGVDTAIDALALLPASTHLVVVGDGPEGGRCRDRAAERGIADRVTLTGRVDDPRPYYGAADAFVQPSLYDPSPGAALEAMACGLPVIATAKSGAAELVLENAAGEVCASGDVAAMAARMQALRDPATRARYSANARRAVLPLSPEAVTLQQVLLYRDLLGAAPRGP